MSDDRQTLCFVDHEGLYIPLARKLADSFDVLYYDPCEQAFPTFEAAAIGDGFEGMRKIRGIWRHKREIDFFVFPDSQGWDLQEELSDQGFPVWGSSRGERLEMDREWFHEQLGEAGLQVPKFTRIEGLSELEEYLRDKEDKYIKINRYRGSIETYHWISMEEGGYQKICSWRLKFGDIAEVVPFFVFEPIKTDLEIGGDTYNVKSEFPSHMLDGTEWKDKAYFGAFKPVEEMPEQTQAVMQAFGPILGELGHRNFWSMEIRVKGKEFFFIDATPRAPLPGTGSQMEIYDNLADIIREGAHGNLVNPEPAAKFSVECILKQEGNRREASSVKVPKELEQWMKLAGCCQVGDRIWFPPDEKSEGDIGWLVAIGDTPRKAIDTMKAYAEMLPDGVTARTEALVDIIKEIESAEEQGIQVTKAKMPEPAEVVE